MQDKLSLEELYCSVERDSRIARRTGMAEAHTQAISEKLRGASHRIELKPLK